MPKSLYINNTDLTRDKEFTYLTESVVSTGSTFRVQSLVGFQSLSTSSGQIVCIGDIGNERTEILRTSSSTALSPTYKEVALLDAMQFDHPQDTKVYVIDWNRADIQWSASTTGAKTTIAAYPVQIQADLKETHYVDTSQTSGFYFIRFNETIGNTNSDWSDPVAFGGYDDNSVFAIKKRAVDESGEEIDGNVITHDYLNTSLWAARREYHQAPGKRPFRFVYNKIIGTALTGSYSIELPTDVEKPFGPQNIYNVKIGTWPDMRWMDKKEWDFYYTNKNHSTLALPYTHNVSTSIWLANGQDFTDSATINVEGASIGLSRITGEKNSFNIITHGSHDASGGSDVWQNASFGLPDRFTVWFNPGGSAYIYFNRPIDTLYCNLNIYADYYRTVMPMDSDADVLDEPDYDMFVDYLKYKIHQRKLRGAIPVGHTRSNQVYIADADYQTWIMKKQNALANEYISNKIRLKPGVEHLPIPNDYGNFVYF